MKLKNLLFLCLSFYILNSAFSIATIRYVCKSGTSTPPYTSWESAADSIQKCINICVVGDTIYVANGVYKENLVINTAISLIGSSMDSTVIDGSGLAIKTLEFISDGLLMNFNIYGQGSIGTARAVYARKYIWIENCNIRNSGIGIGILNSDSFVKNVILSNLYRGYDSGCFSGNCADSFLENCVFIMDKENTTAVRLDIGNNYILRNNVIFFIGTNNSESGISIGFPQKVKIYNNLISGFTDNIFIEINIDSCLIKNNLLLKNTLDGNTGSIHSINDDPVVNNVIFYKNKKAIFGWPIQSNYNLFWQNELNRSGGILGDSDQVADPMFVNDTIPTAHSVLPTGQAGYDFHLQAFSPAIDKGNPDILDLDGTRSDLGMYGGPFGETYTYQDLAPLAPRNLSAVVDTSLILVKWNMNTEADTSYYKVYRDTTINFTIDSTKLISSQTDTFFVHLPPYNSSKYVYKITCVDDQGNESKPSEEVVVDLTSVSTDEYPITINDYLLYQNYPNPFNPSTKIGYKLKERAYVKLMVYDIKGELVTVLVNKEQNAGYYEAEFSSSYIVTGSIKNPVSSIQNIASGIYLYRIEVIGEGNIPVYSEMKKMILIK